MLRGPVALRDSATLPVSKALTRGSSSTLDFKTSKTVRNKFIFLINYSACGSQYTNRKWTKTIFLWKKDKKSKAVFPKDQLRQSRRELFRFLTKTTRRWCSYYKEALQGKGSSQSWETKLKSSHNSFFSSHTRHTHFFFSWPTRASTQEEVKDIQACITTKIKKKFLTSQEEENTKHLVSWDQDIRSSKKVVFSPFYIEEIWKSG